MPLPDDIAKQEQDEKERSDGQPGPVGRRPPLFQHVEEDADDAEHQCVQETGTERAAGYLSLS